MIARASEPRAGRRTQRRGAPRGGSTRTRWVFPLALVALTACTTPSERHALDLLRQLERGQPGLTERGSAAQGAATELAEDAGVDDYVLYALRHNPGLEAAFRRWRAALERVPQVTALPEPRLTYAFFLEQVETRVGPQRQRLGLMQAFPWFGKLSLRGDVALAEARAAAQAFEAIRLKVAYQVREPYFELYYLGRAVAITKENIDLLKYIEIVVRARYTVAAAPYADLIRVQVEQGKLEDRLSTLTDLKDPIQAKLNAALNRPHDAPVPWPKQLAEARPPADEGSVLERLRRASPELKALQAKIARQLAAVKLAEKNYYPDYSLGLTYIETGSARMRTSDSGKDPLVAQIGLTLPLWRGKYEAAEREARDRLTGARHDLAERTNTLTAQVKMALFKLSDAERKVDLFGDTLVPKANQSLKATETAYKGGKASLTDYVDAERILLAFRLEHQRALADRAQRLAELEMLVGGLAAPREEPRGDEAQKTGSKGGTKPD